MQQERSCKLIKPIYLIGSRTRDLASCSILAQAVRYHMATPQWTSVRYIPEQRTVYIFTVRDLHICLSRIWTLQCLGLFRVLHFLASFVICHDMCFARVCTPSSSMLGWDIYGLRSVSGSQWVSIFVNRCLACFIRRGVRTDYWIDLPLRILGATATHCSSKFAFIVRARILCFNVFWNQLSTGNVSLEIRLLLLLSRK
jgi:hypothetical protein